MCRTKIGNEKISLVNSVNSNRQTVDQQTRADEFALKFSRHESERKYNPHDNSEQGQSERGGDVTCSTTSIRS